MMDIRRLWKLFLYAGLEKEEYTRLLPTIHEENRALLNRFEERLDALRGQGMTNRQIIAACLERIPKEAMKNLLDHQDSKDGNH